LRAGPAALMTLLVLPAVYVATWWSWFTADAAWGRDWAENHPGEGVTWLPNALNSLVNYHVDMWQFHSTLTADHPYAAHPLGWIIQLRPTAFHFQDVTVVGCGADRCVSSITALGHPFIWWAGAAALVFALWRVARKADLLALTVITGTLAAWLPWIPFAHRTIFTFYSVAMAPFVVLTLVWALRHAALGEGVERWNRSSAAMVAVFVGVVLIFAGFFIPIWTGQPIPYWYWQSHMWLPSWI
jgi:dolichyl-phosphate-mannose--protein O-mannosyl transferase